MSLFNRVQNMIGAAAFGICAASVPGAASAADGSSPVVVELFTSQGCNSCPPADEMLNELSKRDDVIALSLHVDYWDYIGWKDIFADPAYTKRQKAYARAAGSRTIYTPQVIIGGSEHVVGNRPMRVAEIIQSHKSHPNAVAMSLTSEGDKLIVRIQSMRPLRGEAVLQLVTYRPSAVVEITRGENAGRTIRYTNIVNGWTPVARWDGERPLKMSFDRPSDDPVVAILQEHDMGAILAAARVR